MTALLVIGIIALFFLFLLTLKATVIIEYREEIVLTVKVLVFPFASFQKRKKSGSAAL